MTDPLPPFDRAKYERDYLARYAMRTSESAGREHAEAEHPYRGAFQRDRDRILHSAAFRRLSGKTQVFTGRMGDYHRTRLTHTMEVASIARTLGRQLRLNEDLIEALALLHDIGHPPFGHAGEDALNECLADDGGFSHNQFALTLVRELEQPYPHYPGLNLTCEVLESQVTRVDKQSEHRQPLLEAQVVDVADSVTYDAHDVDDAVKLGLIGLDELKRIPLVAHCHSRVVERFGPMDGKLMRRTLVHELIDVQVSDVFKTSAAVLQRLDFKNSSEARQAPLTIGPSAELSAKKRELEEFLFERVYRHPSLIAGRGRAQVKLKRLFEHRCKHLQTLPDRYAARVSRVGARRAVADYLAGMTDHFCLKQFDGIS